MEDHSIDMGDDSIDMGYLVTLPTGPTARSPGRAPPWRRAPAWVPPCPRPVSGTGTARAAPRGRVHMNNELNMTCYSHGVPVHQSTCTRSIRYKGALYLKHVVYD
jgi:hypothetical protein